MMFVKPRFDQALNQMSKFMNDLNIMNTEESYYDPVALSVLARFVEVDLHRLTDVSEAIEVADNLVRILLSYWFGELNDELETMTLTVDLVKIYLMNYPTEDDTIDEERS